MKISARTKQLLKNFAALNSNVLFTPGGQLKQINNIKTMYAEAEVEEVFPVEFGVYDLNEFLGALSLFDDPEVDFSENEVIISSGKTQVRYLPAEASVLVTPPKDGLKAKAPLASFDLDADSLSGVLKAAGVLKAPFITLACDGENVSIKAHDKASPNANSYKVDVATSDREFEFHIKAEYVSKLLSEKYEVQILANVKEGKASGMKVVFQGDQKKYLIAVEADSTISV